MKEKVTDNKVRKSNFEMLRILSMLMIISFHYVFKSGYSFEVMNFNSFFIKIFYFFGELGVNLFILISGYFMINSNRSIKKIVLIIAEVFFYNFLSILLINFFLKIPIKIEEVFFPVIYNKYWFATAYLIIYILSPYINKFIKSMSKKELERLLIVLITLYCIIPTLFGLRENSTETLLYYSRLIWLIIVYFIGAYIKIYDLKDLSTKKKSLIMSLVVFAIMVCSIMFIYNNKETFNMIGTTEYAYLWMPNNFFMLVLSVSLFQFFAKLKIKPNKIINTLASTTLGVYMLHDGFFALFLWHWVFNTKEKLTSEYFIYYIIATSVLIFIVGAIIDLIRKIIEKYTIDKILELKLFKKIFSKLSINTMEDSSICKEELKEKHYEVITPKKNNLSIELKEIEHSK